MPKRTLIIALGILVATLTLASVWLSAHRSSNLKAPCYRNLEAIKTAKLNWMVSNDKTDKDTPTWSDLKPWLESTAQQRGWRTFVPVCPAGGVYTIGRGDEQPTCSVGGEGHSLGPRVFSSSP